MDTQLYEFPNAKIIAQRHFGKAEIAELTKEYILENIKKAQDVPPEKNEDKQ